MLEQKPILIRKKIAKHHAIIKQTIIIVVLFKNLFNQAIQSTSLQARQQKQPPPCDDGEALAFMYQTNGNPVNKDFIIHTHNLLFVTL